MKKRFFTLALVVTLIITTGTAFASDYIVKQGDTLWKISNQYGTSLDKLIKLNNIHNPDLIYPGQVIKTEGLADVSEKQKPRTIEAKVNIDPYGGADAYEFSGDHADSKYYINPDFFNMTSDEEITIISNFRTYQQTAEWSCGSASILMVIEHFGVSDYNEWDIAVISGAHRDLDVDGSEPGTANNFPEYGSSVDDLIRFFNSIEGFRIVETSYIEDYDESDLIPEGDYSSSQGDWGNLPGKFQAVSLYASDNDPDTENWVEDAKDSYFVKWITGHLKANRPIMVEWGDWDGHWQVIIGYDTMGTPGIGDDIIIFADPYDTSDHWQDGYYCYPAERWFYMWADRNVAPKPYQLQPYVIVEPSK